MMCPNCMAGQAYRSSSSADSMFNHRRSIQGIIITSFMLGVSVGFHAARMDAVQLPDASVKC